MKYLQFTLTYLCLISGGGAFFMLMSYAKKTKDLGWETMAFLVLTLILQCINMNLLLVRNLLREDAFPGALVFFQTFGTLVNSAILVVFVLLLYRFRFAGKRLFRILLLSTISLIIGQLVLNGFSFSAFFRTGSIFIFPPVTNIIFFILLGSCSLILVLRVNQAPIEFREYLRMVLPLFLTLFLFLLGDIISLFGDRQTPLTVFGIGLQIYFFSFFSFTAFHFYRVLNALHSDGAKSSSEEGRESISEKAANRGLSKREMEVLSLMLTGKKNQDIAGELFISLATVKSHTNHIFQKTGTSNRLELFTLLRL